MSGSDWTTHEDRPIAETALTPAQLEVWKLKVSDYGFRRIGRILRISPQAAAARWEAAVLKIDRAKEEAT